MSTQRDELAREIHSTEQLGCGCCTDYNYTREQDQHADKLDVNTRAVAIGDTLIAAGWTKPRTITTVEELKTVYAGCLIREEGGDLWSIDGATDRLFLIVDGADDTYDDDTLTLPAVVLYEPTA